jgi:N12 class adenine-specific DNA methylase
MSYIEIETDINDLQRTIERHYEKHNAVLSILIQQISSLQDDMNELKKMLCIVEPEICDEKYTALKEAYYKYKFVKEMTLGDKQ